jgi:hypothetical protein
MKIVNGVFHAENFVEELSLVINKNSKDNSLNTPDFILAEFLTDCLEAWNKAIKARDKWFNQAVVPKDLSSK